MLPFRTCYWQVFLFSLLLFIIVNCQGSRHHLRKSHQQLTLPIVTTQKGTLYVHEILGNVFPRFSEPINNVTVVTGRDALLHCVVDNLEKYKVAWIRVDSHSILTIHTKVITRNYRISLAQADGRHWVLRIRNVQESDRGWYMCQINTDPMRSQEAYLEVVVPPDITDSSSSTDTIVREGSNVNLTCEAKGHPPPRVLWKREDGALIGQGNQKESFFNGETLVISKVSRLHMGAYLCIASNGIPPSVSKRIMLSVQFAPVLCISNQLEGTSVGQEVDLVCEIEAYPRPIVYWTNERGEMVVPNERYIMTENIVNEYEVIMTLRIRNITAEDFRQYNCVVRNSLGETDGFIKLYEMPTVTRLSSTTPRLDVVKGSSSFSGKLLPQNAAKSNEILDEIPAINSVEPTKLPVQQSKQSNGSRAKNNLDYFSHFLHAAIVFIVYKTISIA